MPIVKCENFIQVYKQKARAMDINELSGRSGRPDLTLYVSQNILSAMNIRQNDVLVDIGCGDGTLLKLAAKTNCTAIGILPTDEEFERVSSALRGAFPEIKILKGLAQATNLDSQTATKVVCNGVFIILPENDVDMALKEIARICKPKALVFIGEIPFKNEFEGKNYGDSILLWLWWVLRKRGLKAFLSQSIFTLKCIFTSEPLIIAPKKHYYAAPDDFIARAAKYGLELKEKYAHREKTTAGKEIESNSRYDYVFEKK